jgi:hypothetical protein
MLDIADAVFAPGGAGFVAAALERVEPAAADGLLDRARIIAGIVKRARRGVVGKFLRRHEIAPDDVERIELELHRDALHQPLQRQIKLRPAKAADQARRHFVGEHHPVRHLDIGNVVGAGHRTVHPIERPRHRRAQKRAVILELIEFQPKDATVLGDRGLDFCHAVRPRACGHQVLDAVLDPFHRPAGDFRRERDQHHVRKHRKFYAKAAAGIGGNAQA